MLYCGKSFSFFLATIAKSVKNCSVPLSQPLSTSGFYCSFPSLLNCCKSFEKCIQIHCRQLHLTNQKNIFVISGPLCISLYVSVQIPLMRFWGCGYSMASDSVHFNSHQMAVSILCSVLNLAKIRDDE